MSEQYYPAGWDEKRITALIDHYDNQSDDDAVAEMERGFAEIDGICLMEVPKELVKEVADLIARRQPDRSPHEHAATS